MKRASFSFLAIAALFIPGQLLASDDVPKLCAEAAQELTGESRYELTLFRPVLMGYDWYEVGLDIEGSETEVTCYVRNGRVQDVSLHQVDVVEGIAQN